MRCSSDAPQVWGQVGASFWLSKLTEKPGCCIPLVATPVSTGNTGLPDLGLGLLPLVPVSSKSLLETPHSCPCTGPFGLLFPLPHFNATKAKMSKAACRTRPFTGRAWEHLSDQTRCRLLCALRLQRGGEPLSRGHGRLYDVGGQVGHTLRTRDTQGRGGLLLISASGLPATVAVCRRGSADRF